jgi:hypothetical protein
MSFCGLRGPPSWAWQKCNWLLRLVRPWGAVMLSQWCVSGDRGGCNAKRGRFQQVTKLENRYWTVWQKMQELIYIVCIPITTNNTTYNPAPILKILTPVVVRPMSPSHLYFAPWYSMMYALLCFISPPCHHTVWAGCLQTLKRAST